MSISIDLELHEHSRFKIKLYGDNQGEAPLFTESKSHELLGKEVALSFTYEGTEKNKERLFKGVFTDVQHSNSEGDYDQILLTLSGYGKTILLDGGPTNSSHLNVTIKDVVGKILSNAGLGGNVNPTHKDTIPYLVQYGESDYEFLRRIAAEYGESFYYDGAKIHFGKMGKGDGFDLALGRDLLNYDLQTRMLPLNTTHFTYFSKDARSEGSDNISYTPAGLNSFGQAALKNSKNFFRSSPRILSPRKSPTTAGLQHAVKVAKQRIASSLTVLKVEVSDPHINIGSTIKVSTDDNGENTYIVIGAHLSLDANKSYVNYLVAVPENLEVLPNPYFRKPVAEPQVGKVVDNNDPDKLGRVQVELLWQKQPERTPFIRIMRPDGGGPAKNRGFYFIPEIDDLVMVGFAQNDPDRPFVMGALPNGKVSDNEKYGTNNDFKSISTRTGSILSFTDAGDKDQEIRIQTDDTNFITINRKSSDGTIKIYSSKAIEVESKETVSVKSKDITIEATDTISLKANKKIEIKAADVLIEASKGLDAKGGATAKIQGAQTEVSGSGKTTVKGGGQLELQAGGIASLKGALVQIN